jgi:hypothetical protein
MNQGRGEEEKQVKGKREVGRPLDKKGGGESRLGGSIAIMIDGRDRYRFPDCGNEDTGEHFSPAVYSWVAYPSGRKHV